MKSYPSIPQCTGQRFFEIEHAHVFDKLDGSNLRAEWSRKAGWYKHGKREGLIDHTNEHLVVAPELFMARLAEPLERLARAQRWQHLVVYYEFWGAKSFAGCHEEGDPKFLTPFDAAADKKDLLDPVTFRRAFEDQVPTPRYLGQTHWTRGYVERVRLGEVEGVTFEGVVAKAGSGHDLVLAKAKTQAWKDRVQTVYGAKAEQIINS